MSKQEKDPDHRPEQYKPSAAALAIYQKVDDFYKELDTRISALEKLAEVKEKN